MEKLNSIRIKWYCTICIPLLLVFVCKLNQVDHTTMMFLALTTMGILMFLFEQIHMVITSVFLMMTYVIFEIASMKVVFSGWLQESIWITFGCLVLVAILEKTTLVERVTFHLIILSGGTYKGILFALIIVGILTNLLIPGVMVGVMIAALAFNLCETLELGKSKASAGIMIGALCVGFYDVETFILSPGNYTLITNSAKEIIDLPMNYWIFFKDNFIFSPLVIIEALVLNKMFAPEEIGNVKEQFQKKLNDLGEISYREKKMIVVLILLLLYLFTEPFHNLSMLYGFIIAPTILFLPGFDLGDSEDISKINYNILVFMVACLGIGNTAVYIGMGDKLANWAVNNLMVENLSIMMGMIFLIAVVVNFLMTPFASMSSLGGSLAQVSQSLHISFYPLSYAFFFGCQTVIFPYETALFAILYGFGNVRLKDFIKFMIIRACMWLVYLMVIGTNYWKFIGHL
jgi:solute carrier family 13 (sodium-dependent dicarboxylate transporter), member 2/3/5